MSSSIRRRKGRSNTRMYLLVGLLLLAMAAYVILPMLSTSSNNASAGNANRTSTSTTTKPVSPRENIDFQKEGTLKFLRVGSGEVVKEIDIEVSGSDSERNQGLMYRQSMKDGEGMLFLFEKSERQSFWMKNTHISLDIIYVNEAFEIVSIGKKTQPLSPQSVSSSVPAMYVVEVLGGFTDAYGITEGDEISFVID